MIFSIKFDKNSWKSSSFKKSRPKSISAVSALQDEAEYLFPCFHVSPSKNSKIRLLNLNILKYEIDNKFILKNLNKIFNITKILLISLIL